MTVNEPAKRPCGSCPYRCNAPSGVWDESEYAKLPEYDKPTGEQPTGLFLCHQQDGRPCAGWVGTHDMDNNLALRLAVIQGHVDEGIAQALCDYETDVELFKSGAEAAEHGMADVTSPGPHAIKAIDKLTRKQELRENA